MRTGRVTDPTGADLTRLAAAGEGDMHVAMHSRRACLLSWLVGGCRGLAGLGVTRRRRSVRAPAPTGPAGRRGGVRGRGRVVWQVDGRDGENLIRAGGAKEGEAGFDVSVADDVERRFRGTAAL